jgi:hypothetical protein
MILNVYSFLHLKSFDELNTWSLALREGHRKRTFHNNVQLRKISLSRKDEIGAAYSTSGGDEKFIILFGKPEGRRSGLEFNCLGQGPVAGLGEYSNEYSK